MKKRRGKQPVKPDLEEALKERLVYLKGQQGSTMNIPIIYRRTFGWDSDSVVFKPINKRSFVVYRSDISREELDPENFIVREVDVGDLPWYPGGRVDADDNDRSRLEEIKESLVSYSLTDRYVHVDVKKVEDRDLDRCLREDLEYLSGELGYSYSTIPGAYRCTFRFPNQDNSQMVKRSMSVLRSTIGVVKDFIDGLLEMDCKEVSGALEDVQYSVRMAERNMDRIYTDALNIHWDRPQTEPAGYFLITQACERVHDEIEYMVDCSREMMDLFSCSEKDDVMELLFEEFISMWRSPIKMSLERMVYAMNNLDGDGGGKVSVCLEIIREYRQNKQHRTSIQDRSISDLAAKIEGLSMRNVKESGMKLFARKECIGSIELLFGMNQSAVRINNLAKMFSTKQLYMENSRILH